MTHGARNQGKHGRFGEFGRGKMALLAAAAGIALTVAGVLWHGSPEPPPPQEAIPVPQTAPTPEVQPQPEQKPEHKAEIVPEPTPPPAPPPPEPVPPPAAPALELEPLRTALQAIRCAVLDMAETDGTVTVSGTATSESIRPQLQSLLDRYAGGLPHRVDLRLASPALCEPLTLIEAHRAANAAAAAPLSIRPSVADAIYHGGQELVFDVAAPDFPAYLQVDYYTADGNVVHLLPNPLETSGQIEPRAQRRLGDRAAGGRFWTIGPPFGNELIVVVASPAPLFPTPRPEAEAASAYLPELKRALESTDQQAVAEAVFIATTAP